MNTGIQDSFNLGWKLAHVLLGKGGFGLLDSYEQERRPIAAAVGASGDVVEELRTIPDDPAAVARVKRALCAMLLTASGRQQAARDETEIDFHYRDTPLVRGHHANGETAQQSWMGPLPGDCLPDAGPLLLSTTEESQTLFHLMQTNDICCSGLPLIRQRFQIQWNSNLCCSRAMRFTSFQRTRSKLRSRTGFQTSRGKSTHGWE